LARGMRDALKAQQTPEYGGGECMIDCEKLVVGGMGGIKQLVRGDPIGDWWDCPTCRPRKPCASGRNPFGAARGEGRN